MILIMRHMHVLCFLLGEASGLVYVPVADRSRLCILSSLQLGLELDTHMAYKGYFPQCKQR